MTELIESLLEFSRTRETLHTSHGDLRDAVNRAIQSVKAHPEFHGVHIKVECDGPVEGWFDFKKLERALQNLLLNACEAVSPQTGEIEVNVQRNGAGLEIRVQDNGPGIAEVVRERLFEPFISYGKENGTGMGLTVVQKILQDHGGDISVEQSTASGTTFKSVLPINGSPERAYAVKNATT
jgi:signal transduction histidine kinase